jgi:class 3 adenylate cyclase
VPARDAARALVEASDTKKREGELLAILIETDGEKLEGRRVTINGLEEFLSAMTRSGLIYDFDRRSVRRSEKDAAVAPNWGSLREGRTYPVTVASIDIVGNSELVRINGMRTMEKAYFRFWSYLNHRLAIYNGRTWSWAGDGGILAFALKNHEVRAVQWALEVQATLPVFNAGPDNPIAQNFCARIGIDTGKIRFRSDTGRIVSDSINYAAHMEKSVTHPGYVSISDRVHEVLPEKLAAQFETNGMFEDRRTFLSVFGSVDAPSAKGCE